MTILTFIVLVIVPLFLVHVSLMFFAFLNSILGAMLFTWRLAQKFKEFKNEKENIRFISQRGNTA
jgi:hypothetical protein